MQLPFARYAIALNEKVQGVLTIKLGLIPLSVSLFGVVCSQWDAYCPKEEPLLWNKIESDELRSGNSFTKMLCIFVRGIIKVVYIKQKHDSDGVINNNSPNSFDNRTYIY